MSPPLNRNKKDTTVIEMESGMIGDKEVQMHRLAKFVWAIDIVRHTSEDTKELVYGWVVGDEQKAHDLYHEKVNELKQEEE